MNRIVPLVLAAIVLAGCAIPTPESPPTGTPTLRPAATAEPSASPTPQPEPSATALPTQSATTPAELTKQPTSAPAESHPGLPLPKERGALFSASGACAICHSNMTDQSGNDVSIDSFWRATMMANAARDPYWRATMRTETIKNSAYREVIEDKCATCHTPMAHFTDIVAGGSAALLDDGYLNEGHALHALALDGVSCTLCHQIEDQDLGQLSSYSGHYVIDDQQPAGERVNYGPFPVSEASANLMKLSSGFLPVESKHVKQAALCATCHTLYTPYLDAAGGVAGEFPEQTPYLEWLYSDYRGRQSCQGCHMPKAAGGVVLSITGGDPRQPFAQHNFVGGNAFMLTVLRTFPDENQVTASSDHFEATIGRVYDQLESRTATAALENVQVSGGTLSADVRVTNLAGHKLPTGFPARRVWLHLTVTDPAGAVVFESGAAQSDGLIAGNNNDTDPAAFEPHYLTITSADQVQIYEAIMQDTEGQVTTTLLKGAGYIKDNRLLPAGFIKGNHLPDVAVHGAALDDPDFVGGGDLVRYEIDLGGAGGPFTVQVELLYQSVGYRWAQNLAGYDAPEVETFLAYYQAVPNTPLAIASASATAQ